MSKSFAVMLKPSGAICNLDCHYCYYLSKEQLYPGSRFRMSDDMLANYTRQFIASQPGPEVTFAWQGGEPLLMGLDFFQRAVNWQRRYCPPNKVVSNSIQTNGVLLDDAWCDFLAGHQFLVGLSLDGPPALHDAYRVDKGGRPTFARVMAGLRRLQKHQVAVNILTTVHAANGAHPLEVYRFIRDEAAVDFIQFIPIVERQNETGYQAGDTVTARSVGAQQYGDFLIAVFDEWVRRDVGRVFVQIFDVALGIWLGQGSGLCIFAETCGRALALEHNGDLYACDHFVEPDYYLGNIAQKSLPALAASPAQRAFGQAKQATLPRYCRECEVRFVCNGGCPKERFIKTPDGEAGLNYLCAGYRAFFNHIRRPMQFMAVELLAGRQCDAPGGIDRWLKITMSARKAPA
jgi:uncharacterized protein